MEQKAKKLCVIIIAVIVVQFICRYYAKFFVYANGFMLLTFLLRFGVPILAVALYLKIPWKNLGISVPKISKTGLLWLIGVLFLVPACLYLIKLNPAYQSYYRQFAGASAGTYRKFAVFTASTLLGWEFLHRGFLLFGLRQVLGSAGSKESTDHLSEQTAAVLTILIVAAFETLYHFIKPDMEAFGMMAASPVLSWIALRTGSIFIPLLIHLYVELWFVIFVGG